MPVRTRSRAARGKEPKKGSGSSKNEEEEEEDYDRPPELERKWTHTVRGHLRSTDVVESRIHSVDTDLDDVLHSSKKAAQARKTRRESTKTTTGKRKQSRSRTPATRKKATKRSSSSATRKSSRGAKSKSPAPKKRATRSSSRSKRAAAAPSKSSTLKKTAKSNSTTRSSSRSRSTTKANGSAAKRKLTSRSSSRSKSAGRTKISTPKKKAKRSLSKRSSSRSKSATKSKSPTPKKKKKPTSATKAKGSTAKTKSTTRSSSRSKGAGGATRSTPKKKAKRSLSKRSSSRAGSARKSKSPTSKKPTKSSMRSPSTGRKGSAQRKKKTVVVAESKNTYDDISDNDDKYDRPPLLERMWTHTLRGHTRSEDVHGSRLVRRSTAVDGAIRHHTNSDGEERPRRLRNRGARAAAGIWSRFEETFSSVTTRAGEEMAAVTTRVGEKLASLDASGAMRFLKSSAESDAGPYYVQRFFRCAAFDGFFLNGQAILGGDIQYMLLLPFIVWVIDPAHMQNIALAVIQRYFLTTYFGNALKDLLRLKRCPRGRVRRLTNEFDNEYGFPSTHVAASLAVFLPLVLIMHFNAKRTLYYDGDMTGKALVILLGTRARATALWLSYVSIIGFSRLYLGLNSLMDVAGGVILGFASMFVSNQLTVWLEFMAFSITSVFWQKNIIFALSLSAIIIFMVMIYPDRRVNSTCYQNVLGIAGIMVGGLVQMAIMDFFHVAFKNGKYMRRGGNIWPILGVTIGTAMLLLVRKSARTLFRSVGARQLEISPKMLYALEFAVIGAFVVFSPIALDVLLAR